MAEPRAYSFRSAEEFDFAGARRYRKTKILNKSRTKWVTAVEEVVTVIDGREETRNIAQSGDAIVTGGAGERYVIKAEKFGALYASDPCDASQYVSKNVVRALELAEKTELLAPWGQLQRADAGSFVVQPLANPTDVYLIAREAFLATYAPIEEASN